MFSISKQLTALHSPHCDRSLCSRPFGGLLKQLESATCFPPKVFTHTFLQSNEVCLCCKGKCVPQEIFYFDYFSYIFYQTAVLFEDQPSPMISFPKRKWLCQHVQICVQKTIGNMCVYVIHGTNHNLSILQIELVTTENST